jgi:hypothetical protein
MEAIGVEPVKGWVPNNIGELSTFKVSEEEVS